MSSGKRLHVVFFFLFQMLCLAAWSTMFLNIALVVCMLVVGDVSMKSVVVGRAVTIHYTHESIQIDLQIL